MHGFPNSLNWVSREGSSSVSIVISLLLTRSCDWSQVRNVHPDQKSPLTSDMHPTGAPMTLGNTREQGVHQMMASCHRRRTKAVS